MRNGKISKTESSASIFYLKVIFSGLIMIFAFFLLAMNLTGAVKAQDYDYGDAPDPEYPTVSEGAMLAWAKDAGGSSYDIGNAIAVDGSGYSYITGRYYTSAIFGEGETNQTTLSGVEYEIFVAKYDSYGALVWAKDAGGSINDIGNAIAVDGSGYTYITGFYEASATFGEGESNVTTLSGAGYEIFVAKYDSYGALVWAKDAGGSSNDIGYGIAVDGSGYTYITGRYTDSATFGEGVDEVTLSGLGFEIFVAKYNSEGALVWAKDAGGSINDIGYGVTVDSSGFSYVTGRYEISAIFGEGGDEVTLSGTGSEIFAAKYGSDGALVWAKDAGGSLNDSGQEITVDGSGYSYITGSYYTLATFGEGGDEVTLSGTYNEIFVAKYDSDGALVWARDAGGSTNDIGYGIAVDSSGYSYVTGYYNISATFGEGEFNQTTLSGSGDEIFVAKYNSDGTLAWAKDAGGSGDDRGQGIAVDGNGYSYVIGSYFSSSTFGEGVDEVTLSGTGEEIFVVKYETFIASPALHVLDGTTYLGACVDREEDGQPLPEADGDDNNTGTTVTGTCAVAGDDEDGVTFGTIVPGLSATVDVVASTAGNLSVWIDWNADGDWDDIDEQVFADQSLSAGTNNLNVIVPAGAVAGDTFARFRFSSETGVGYDGTASDGEVEDYKLFIANPICAFYNFPYTIGTVLSEELDTDLQNAIDCANSNLTDDTIDLNGQTVTLTDSYGNYSGATALPSITSTITLQNGTLDRSGTNKFRFLHVGSGGILTLDTIILQNADSVSSGAALYTEGESIAAIKNSTIQNNRSGYEGGAIFLTSSEVTVLNSIIKGNQAVNGGGAFRTTDAACALTVVNTLIIDNESQLVGGVMDHGDGVSRFVNTTIANNRDTGTPALVASILWYNAGTVEFSNSILWHHTVPRFAGSPTINYSVAEGGFTGMGNTANDPEFVDSANGNYRVKETSPAINMGNNNEDPDGAGSLPPMDDNSWKDLDNNKRIEFSTIDAGAYEIQIGELKDYGDAPDPGYKTMAINGGAEHVLDNITYLGACVDSEADGQPTTDANGDDNNTGTAVTGTCVEAGDDEDGVTFGTLEAGSSTAVDVLASTSGNLSAWIDWNADGDWDDTGEQVFADQSLSAGINNLSVFVPFGSIAGDTYARYRVSSETGLSYDGTASDGEVEDYKVEIQNLYDYGDAPDPEYPTLKEGLMLEWAKGAGGGSGDRGNGIAIDGSGYSYVTGYYNISATFGAGETNQTTLSGTSTEIFVAKYNSEGTLAWAKDAGGSYSDSGKGIAVDDSGYIYVTGSYYISATFGEGEPNQTTLSGPEYEIFVAKYNSEGTLVWAKNAGGSFIEGGNGIAVDDSGYIYVTGYYQTSAIFGGGEPNQTTLSGTSTEIFIAKYNSDGTLAWAKDAGGSSYDIGSGIAVDGSGYSYVTGYYDTSATFGEGEANQTALSGSTYEIFVAKYSNDGTLAWAKDAGGNNGDYGNGIVVDGNGYSYVTGCYNTLATFGEGINEAALSGTGNEIFVAKYNSDGTLAWVKDAGGSSYDYGYGIAVDGSGSSYVTGSYYTSATFGEGESNESNLSGTGYEIFVAKYNSDGTLAWAKDAGGSSADSGNGIEVDGSGYSYVTGSYYTSATFGEGEVNQTTLSGTGYEIFVAKYETFVASPALHALDGTKYLGTCVDSEADGQPQPGADGDDNSTGTAVAGTCAVAGDDEDGVIFGNLVAGLNVAVDVVASAAGKLSVWIDWNADGDWDDIDEQVFADQSVIEGTNNMNVQVPLGAAIGNTFARFRFSSDTGLGYDGPASDGEVEDYKVTIAPLDCSFYTFPYTVGTVLGTQLDIDLQNAIDCANINVTDDTIELNGQTVTFTDSYGDYSGTTALPSITSTISLQNGTLNRSGTNKFRFLHVGSGGILTLDTIILQNADSVSSGAALYTEGGSTTKIRNSTIQNNRTDGDGGAIYLTSSDVNVLNTIIKGNQSALGGGAFRTTDAACTLTVVNTLIIDNESQMVSGVIDQDNGVSRFVNTTIANNRDTGNTMYEASILWHKGGTIEFSNSILWHHTVPRFAGSPTINYSVAEGGFTGMGNTASDPEFVDSANGNYRLKEISPAINMGNNNEDPDGAGSLPPMDDSSWKDLDNNKRIEFSTIDAGAYEVKIKDYGDTPDLDYKTLAINGGAEHVLDNITYLGACVDSEADGQPTTDANGDDNNTGTAVTGTCVEAGDDEDGVTFGTLEAGSSTAVDVLASTSGNLSAWIDWNADGDWDDTDEQVFADRPLSAGINNLGIFVPFGPIAGDTYARFRFSSDTGLSYDGQASDGEVEDYKVTIQNLFDYGDAPDPDYPTLKKDLVLAWAKDAGGNEGDVGQGIAVDGSGDIYVTGYYNTSATFGEGEANQTTLSGTGRDIFVAKYNSDGTLAWATDAGGSSDDRGQGIAVDGSGYIFVTGFYNTSATFGEGEAYQTTLSGTNNEIFVAKYNNDGTLAWAKDAGGSYSDSGNGIAVDGSGYSYVTGSYYTSAIFGAGEGNQTTLSGTGTEIFVAKYNSDGTLAWAKDAGGSSDDQGQGIAVDVNDYTYVTGYYNTSATFGEGGDY